MSDERNTTRWRRMATMSPPALIPVFLLGALAFTAGGEPNAAPGPDRAAAPTSTALDRLEARAVALEARADRIDRYYDEHVRPVERMLRPFHTDQRWVRRVSHALVRQGRETGLDPRALASVLLVENPWLDPEIESFVGAVGLMQVMPVHAGNWGCGSDDLTDPEVNICHGSRIFAEYLRRHGDLDRALLAYNGCVHGSNTPDCHLYPSHVYSRAGRAALSRWLDDD